MMPPRIDLRRYAVVPVWYKCNNDCAICMLTGLKERLPAVGFEQFAGCLGKVCMDGRFDSLILSGAEITTFGDLERYARHAASLGYFKKIQIQTNGRMLSSKKFTEKLLDAGVNEFFISVHGLETIHDAITRVPGSWAQTMEGIKNLEGRGANVLTNTVLTSLNIDGIPSLLRLLCGLSTSEIHVWNYYPMEETDSKGLVVRMDAVASLIKKIVPVAREAGKALVLKSFPECITVEQPAVIDNGYPMNLIHPDFWQKFSSNRFGTCRHLSHCAARECWGLSAAYRGKFGDEEDLLFPIPAKRLDRA